MLVDEFVAVKKTGTFQEYFEKYHIIYQYVYSLFFRNISCLMINMRSILEGDLCCTIKNSNTSKEGQIIIRKRVVTIIQIQVDLSIIIKIDQAQKFLNLKYVQLWELTILINMYCLVVEKGKASTSSNFINGQSQIKKKKQNRDEKGMS